MAEFEWLSCIYFFNPVCIFLSLGLCFLSVGRVGPFKRRGTYDKDSRLL